LGKFGNVQADPDSGAGGFVQTPYRRSGFRGSRRGAPGTISVQHRYNSEGE